MALRLSIVNGPNLNLLGVREPHIYGSTTLDAIEKGCREFASFPGVELDFSQSNHEGAMVDTIQAAVRTVGKLPATLPAPLAVGPV